MSRFIYGIQIWGLNAAKTIINKVQMVQNLAMKWITGENLGISTRKLLDKLGWLSIFQLSIYHSVLFLWKVKNKNEPVRTIEILKRTAKTRPRIELTERIWSRKAVYYFNKLGSEIRTLDKISTFKVELKHWIKTNVPISEDNIDPWPETEPDGLKPLNNART